MIKNNDFVEINYTGKIKDNKEVFDTTQEQVAKDNDLFNEQTQARFKPIIICIGLGQIIPGIDKALIGKKVGDSFSIDITPEEGFGKKSSELINLVPMNLFKKQNIRPMVGLQVNIDNQIGIIRSVSGGRVIIDFNHPMAGRDLNYDIKVLKIIEDKKEKIKITMKSIFQMDADVDFDKEKNTAKIKLKLPDNIPKDALNEEIKNIMITKLKEITKVDCSFE